MSAQLKMIRGSRPYQMRVNDSLLLQASSLGSLSASLKEEIGKARSHMLQLRSDLAAAEQQWLDLEEASSAVEAAIRAGCRS